MRTGLIERPDHRLKQFRGDEIEHREALPKIGEVAEKLGVHPSKIRYLEAYFGLEGKRNHKSERLFTPDEIAHLRRLIAVCDRSKLSFAKRVAKAGMLSEFVAFVNQVAEKTLTKGVPNG